MQHFITSNTIKEYAKNLMMIFFKEESNNFLQYYLLLFQDWTRRGGWKVTVNRPPVYPGDKDFPKYRETKAHDYAKFGFEKSPI